MEVDFSCYSFKSASQKQLIGNQVALQIFGAGWHRFSRSQVVLVTLSCAPDNAMSHLLGLHVALDVYVWVFKDFSALTQL